MRIKGISADCAYFCQRYFVEGLRANAPFETLGTDYLRNLEAQERIYQMAQY